MDASIKPPPPLNAREWLDAEIERTEQTGDMFVYMATAVRDMPQVGGETYRADCIGALLHGAEIVRSHKINLLHVAFMYDRKAVDAEPAG